MFKQATSYIFAPAGAGLGTVTLTGLNIPLSAISIIAVEKAGTGNSLLYAFNSNTEFAYAYSQAANSVLTFALSTAAYNNTDRLYIIYDDGQGAATELKQSAIIEKFNGSTISVSRTTALSSTTYTIKNSGGELYAHYCINPNTVPVYLKYYNVSNPIVGTTVPFLVREVPSGTAITPAIIEGALVTQNIPIVFSDAIKVAAVTGLADSSTAAPSIDVYFEAFTK